MGGSAMFDGSNGTSRYCQGGVPLVTIALLGLLVVGCRPAIPLGQVEGTIRMAGRPLQNVVITFIPKGNGAGAPVRSFGQPEATGRFRLKTEQGDEGAVVGEHVAILEDLSQYEAPRSDDGTLLQRPVERFPAAYADPLRSPWRVTVRAGRQTIDLNVEFQ